MRIVDGCVCSTHRPTSGSILNLLKDGKIPRTKLGAVLRWHFTSAPEHERPEPEEELTDAPATWGAPKPGKFEPPRPWQPEHDQEQGDCV